MNVLVVYGSTTGCTQGIAEHIAARLEAAGDSVVVTAADKSPDPSAFDAVVVGSGVRAGQWHEPVRTWVAANAEVLKGRPVAFYTCGLTLASDPTKTAEVRAYTDPLIEATGVTPVDVGTFAGMNDPKRFSFVERTIMKLMKAPVGDFRDFDAVDAWADGVAGRLVA